MKNMHDDFILDESYNTEDSLSIEKNMNDLDSLFNNLSNDVTNINKMINEVTKGKKNNEIEQKNLNDFKAKLDKEKTEFEEYVKAQKEELKRNRAELDQYVNLQQNKLKKAEATFKDNMSNALTELEIEKKTLALDKESFAKEKEQFVKYKEVAFKKIELENKNLEQKCLKFKEIMSQFNSNFEPMFNEE